MPDVALVLFAVYFALAFGMRSLIHKARTGSTGFRGISGSPGSIEWLGGVLFVIAIVLGVVAPVLDFAGALDSIDPLDGEYGHAAGYGLFLGGLLTTLAAQFAMGDSWRVGVDESEQTELVTDGPFAAVRNPTFAGMVPVSFGLALLVPNVVAILAVVALIVALQIQTRLIEEPYLLRTHGDAYADYASRVGRFVPGVGRLRRG